MMMLRPVCRGFLKGLHFVSSEEVSMLICHLLFYDEPCVICSEFIVLEVILEVEG